MNSRNVKIRNPNLCVPSRPLRLRGKLFQLKTTSSPENNIRALPEPLDTCLPGIEQIEAELGRIGEEDR